MRGRIQESSDVWTLLTLWTTSSLISNLLAVRRRTSLLSPTAPVRAFVSAFVFYSLKPAHYIQTHLPSSLHLPQSAYRNGP